MSWTDRFLTDLRNPHLTPRFLLESIAVGSFAIDDCRLSSFRLEGYEHVIDPTASSISYGELQIPSWVRTATTMRIGVVKNIVDIVRPGQVFRLFVGFGSYAIEEYQPVFVGALRSLTYSGGRWMMELVDLAYSLQSRWVRDAGEGRLFDSLDGGGAVFDGVDYTVGDATITCTSTSGFQRQDGGSYLLRIEPDSGADPFFLTASGKTGTSFTGLSSTGQYGTTAVDTNGTALSQIYNQALIESHPLTTARRVLVSTGTSGANGAHDVLPSTWGYGLPTELVAGNDIERQVEISSPATGSAAWDWVVQEAQDDGQSYLMQFLAPGGFFLAIRQGKVSARAVCNPDAIELPDSWDLADGEVEVYTPWDPTVIECQTVVFNWPPGTANYESTSTENLTTRPSFRKTRIDFPDVWGNYTAWGDSLDLRLRPFLARRGERIVVRQPGFGASASLGDCVRLTARIPKSRWDARGDGWQGRRCLVVGGGPDWFRGVTRLVLVTVDPSSSDG